MKTDKLIETLELYSNAITGFLAVQSIGFAIMFGTSVPFSCEVARYKYLAVGLLIHFSCSWIAAVWGLLAISMRIVTLSHEENEPPSQLVVDTVLAAAKGRATALIWHEWRRRMPLSLRYKINR